MLEYHTLYSRILIIVGRRFVDFLIDRFDLYTERWWDGIFIDKYIYSEDLETLKKFME